MLRNCFRGAKVGRIGDALPAPPPLSPLPYERQSASICYLLSLDARLDSLALRQCASLLFMHRVSSIPVHLQVEGLATLSLLAGRVYQRSWAWAGVSSTLVVLVDFELSVYWETFNCVFWDCRYGSQAWKSTHLSILVFRIVQRCLQT